MPCRTSRRHTKAVAAVAGVAVVAYCSVSVVCHESLKVKARSARQLVQSTQSGTTAASDSSIGGLSIRLSSERDGIPRERDDADIGGKGQARRQVHVEEEGKQDEDPNLPPLRVDASQPLPPGVKLWHDLCIEDLPPSQWDNRTVQAAQGVRFVESITKRIVVYNSDRNATESFRIEQSSDSAAVWTMHFTEAPPPETHVFADHPLYLVSLTCEGNAYHFFSETLAGLYENVNATGHLHSKQKVQLTYDRASRSRERHEPGCWGMRYEKYLRTLPIREDHGAFFELPTNLCYRDVVVGNPPGGRESYQGMVGHILDSFGLTHDRLQCLHNEFVIVQRAVRRLLNVEEIANMARDLGFAHVTITSLEGRTIEEQVRIIRCASVIVMPHGSAVSYAIFMRPGTHIIQVSIGDFPPDRDGSNEAEVGFAAAADAHLHFLKEHDVHANPNHRYVDTDGRALSAEQVADGATERLWYILKFMDVRVNIDNLRNIVQGFRPE